MVKKNFTIEVVQYNRLNYKVTNVYFEEYKYLMPGKSFFDVPDDIAMQIKADVFYGNIVTIRKKVLESGIFTADDFTISKVSKFETTKNRAIIKEKSAIAALAVNTSFFEIYEFIAVTGMLASQGIFITNENREETYLNIINTGDEELISALETYLEIKDTMDTLFKRYKNRVEYLKALEGTEDEKQLTSVLKAWDRE